MADIEALKKRLQEIEKIPDEKWIQNLDSRKKQEIEFHDIDRDKARIASLDSETYDRFYSNRKYYRTTSLSENYVDHWIKLHAKDNVFLDYACGSGKNAVKASKAGAALSIGLDISPISIQNAKEYAIEANVKENTSFIQADAENTLLPESSINVIICSGMLHHLDLSYALPELRRILAPGGRILAVEALSYNPLIKLYRHMTPHMRTEWEKSHILSLKDIGFASRFFDIGEINYWHITGVLGAYLRPLMPVFNAIDSLLTRMPFVKLMAWIFTFELFSKK